MVEGGKGETEAEETPRGNLLRAGEEGEEETCRQDKETEEMGEEERQGEGPALCPASSQFHFLLWTC